MQTVRIFFFTIICYLISFSSSAQNTDDLIISNTQITVFDEVDPLAPSKAAFYSAIVPGLGQIYNKKYWKAPIVWAALGTSTYFVIENNKQYHTYRDAFKLSKAGKPHEFDGSDGGVFISDESLERAQTSFKEARDLAIFITIGIYALQIIEASVNAHLMNINTIDNLSFRPNIIFDPFTAKPKGGLSISYKFK